MRKEMQAITKYRRRLILLLAGVLLLFTTSGCIIVGHRGGGEFHEHEFHGHLGPPVIVEPEVDMHFHAD